MRREIPLEVSHVRQKLLSEYQGKLQDVSFKDPVESERNFLSRALAAFTIQKNTGCTADEAAGAVVDGSRDGGIDAVYYSPISNVLWLVQSKFIAEGHGEPGLGDVTKFKSGVENLLGGNFDDFQDNVHWQPIIPQIKRCLDEYTLAVRVILVYSGIHSVSEDRRRLFERLRTRFALDADDLTFQFINLTTIHDWITGADQQMGVQEAELKLRFPGRLLSPYETWYGVLRLAELAQLYQQHGKLLIAANIRGYKGKTEVNEQILKTLHHEPEHFVYLNNGLTAYCERIEIRARDRANEQEKQMKVYGFSIVNGAQTLGAIAKYFEQHPQADPQGHVFLKIISLQHSEDNKQFAGRITRSTNYQNQVNSRDFVALDEQQERIAIHLKYSGITYHYKVDADMPEPDEENFTLEEATQACACLVQQKDCDFCARLLANLQSLWSMESDDQVAGPSSSRYSRVFLPERSARTVWRAVQTRRVVVGVMQSTARSSDGIRRTFFQNARWLVLNLVYNILRPEQSNELTLTSSEATEVSTRALELAEKLWTICEAKGFVSSSASDQSRHFRSVFSNASDCQGLRNAMLVEIGRAASPTPIPPANIPSQSATESDHP